MSSTEPRKKPEWAPQDGSSGDSHFASGVMPGVAGGHDGMPEREVPARAVKKRRRLEVSDYVEGVLEGDRTILARTITLIESNAPGHFETAQKVLAGILPKAGKSVRVGITGVPGAGKSTFIEALGCMLTERGHKVAVLAVDPSSTVTGGSILGDKTRMELLARDPNAFIRPSPSSGALGGVARKSRETMLVCEAAGFDVILVETVGVGQSEVTVRSMVDFFLLLQIAGAGDELQGIKKGVIELADALFVNKADGDNLKRARMAKAEYARVLHFLQPATEGWETRAHLCSALDGDGIAEAWGVVEAFVDATRESGMFDRRRQDQAVSWMHALIDDYLKSLFYHDPRIAGALPRLTTGVGAGDLTPTAAVRELARVFEEEEEEAGGGI